MPQSLNRIVVTAVGLLVLGVLVTLVLPAGDEALHRSSQEKKPLTALEERGRQVFLREGCWACHTEQVRAIEAGFAHIRQPGDIGAASEGGEYAARSPALLGARRRGPDLTRVGARLSSKEWHVRHHQDPQAASTGSIMQPYGYLSPADLDALAAYMLSLK